MVPSPLPRRLVLALALALPLAGHAQASPLQMSLIDRHSGMVLPLYGKDSRLFAAGQPGSRYAIRLSNQSNERVLVVLSVDGINVVTGQTAAWNQTGYVLHPWQSTDIAGWRKSDHQVAAFEFAALSNSYAARTGRPDHVGVIGAAVFAEEMPPPPPLPAPALNDAESRPQAKRAAEPLASAAPRMDQAPAAAGSMAAPLPERLGTAHGRREWSPISHTAFQRRSSEPQAVHEIWYDSMPRLIAAGIVPAPQPVARSFPSSPGYVPDPPPR